MKQSEDEFIKLVETIGATCSKDRAGKLLRFITHARIKEGLLVAPASSSKQYHHCLEGGLLIHTNQMVKIALCMRECGEPIKNRITEENLVTTILLHDMHKVCDPYGSSYYVTNLLKSGKTSDAKPYKIHEAHNDIHTNTLKYEDNVLNYFTENAQVKPSGHLSLMTVLSFDKDLYDDLSDDEKQAIIYHGGCYEVSKFELQGKESMLQLILHTADMLSSRFHDEEW